MEFKALKPLVNYTFIFMEKQPFSETLIVMVKTKSKDPILVLHFFKIKSSQEDNTLRCFIFVTELH